VKRDYDPRKVALAISKSANKQKPELTTSKKIKTGKESYKIDSDKARKETKAKADVNVTQF
jgi:hypothetical protein